MARLLKSQRYRPVLLTWAAIWPLITLLLLLGEPLLSHLPLPLRTLALTGVLVPLMSFVVMPRLTRWAAGVLGEAVR